MAILTDEERREAEHLGDGLYATFDGYQIWLFASNGEERSPKLALEQGTYLRLRSYAASKWGREPGNG